MSIWIIAGLLWIVAAWALMVVLSAKQSWPAAYVLIAVAMPILYKIYESHGALVLGVAIVTVCLVLRWPVIYLGRWLKRLVRGRIDE